MGYPEDLFDAYLPGAKGTDAKVTAETYAALRELGISDSTGVQYLRLLQSDSLSVAARDSLLRLRDSTFHLDTAYTRRLSIRADVEDSLVKLDSGYNIFGLDVFRKADTQFDAALGGPVDGNYRLGPGDQMVLTITGDLERSYSLAVGREGSIVIPTIGPLYVANLTLDQLDDLLYSRLGRVYSGVRRGSGATTQFSVSVTGLRTNQVFVLGEALHPGSYVVSSAGTAITALYAAGGPTASGSMRNVQIKRGRQTVSTLDLYDYLLRGDATRDVRLQTGDIVFVPAREARVRIVGEVIRPGTYEIKPAETLSDLIVAAGGYRANASRRRLQIERILPPEERTVEGRERVTIDVQTDHAANGTATAIPLVAGDLVRVFAITNRLRGTVTVKGNVWAPGPQGFTPGMKVSDAIRGAGGPKSDVYLGRVLVDRLEADSTRIQLHASLRDSTGNVANDFALQEDDHIQVFGLTEFRPNRYVDIGGAVNRPGTFPYREGMTIRDLVLLAGGLTEGAYLGEAEVARLPEKRDSATAVAIRVPLDSSYVFSEPRPNQLASASAVTQAGVIAEFVLKPYDHVLILQQRSWQLQRVVSISGEVAYPGQYALRTRTERLADLIVRAGGFTPDAYPDGVVFTRPDVGRVAIDVPLAVRDQRSPENLLLQAGDQIVIPQRSHVVTVRGAVNAPNVVAYAPGKPMSYYVDQAGGRTRNADYGRSFVTQPNGKRETKGRFHSPMPRAGSLVVVPEKGPSTAAGSLKILGTVSQAVASLIAIVLTVRKL